MDIINRNRVNKKSDIKITMSISLAILIIFMVILSDIFRINNLDESSISVFIQVLNCILCIVSTITSLFHYSISRKEEMFIIALMFLSLSVDMVIFYFDIAINRANVYDTFVLSNYIIRIGILFMTILPINKIKGIIFYNKKAVLVVISIISVVANRLEYDLNMFSTIKSHDNIKLVIVSASVIYLIIAITYMYKSIKRKDYSDLIIGSASMIMSLRCFYKLSFIFLKGSNDQNDLASVTIAYICFVIFTCEIIYDISKKMKTISSLKDDFSIFYNISENNQFNQIFICDKNRNIIYINSLARSRYSKLCGNDINKHELTDIISKLTDTIPNEVIDNIDKCVNTSGYWEGILDNVYEDTVVFCTIQASHTNDGECVYMVSLRDDTEKYKLQKIVEENERKLKLLTDNTNDLIMMIDRNYTITYVNKIVVDRVGYTEDELIGKNVCKYNIKERIVENKLDDEEGTISIYDLKCKDGGTIRLETMKTPICDENGEISGYIFIARDMEYTEMFEELKIKYEEMKSHHKVKNDFFANLSHELKTPLNIFYSIIQLLDKKSEIEEEDFKGFYKQYNKGLRVNFYRMFRLINNLIDITKLESGFIEPKFENHNIVNLAENITLSVVPFASEKNINIIFDTEEEENYLKCDGESIERIMLNLLSNAIKFTNIDGNIAVNLEVDENWVKIIILDDGIGVPEDMQKSIFEKFVQVDKPSHRENEGSGMGLSIVKSLLDLHDGKIELESFENKGSKFTVWLPNKMLEIIDMNQQESVYNIDSNRIRLELSDIYDVL